MFENNLCQENIANMTLETERLSSLCPDHCFICGTEKVNLNLNSDDIKLCERFCVLVGRYLNINPENNLISKNFEFDFEKTLKTNENTKSEEIHCCESCFVEVEPSCRLFEQFSLIELELNARIKSVAGLMKNRKLTYESEKDEARRKKIEHEEKFQNAVVSRVEQNFPRLRLKTLKTVTTTATKSNVRATRISHSHHTNLPSPEVVHIDSSDSEDMDSVPASNSDLTEMLPPAKLNPVQATTSGSTHRPHSTVQVVQPITQINPEKVLLQAKLSAEDGKSIQIVGTPTNLEMLSSSFLQCRFCDNCYISEESRAEHEQTHDHENQQELETAPPPPPVPAPAPLTRLQYHCRFCDFKSSRIYILQGHVRMHLGQKPFSCSICHKKFTLRYGCSVHNRRVHNGNAVVVTDPSFVENCAESDFPVYKTTTKIPFEPLACRYCGRGFTKRLVLLEHEKTHSNRGNQDSTDDTEEPNPAKPYICQICGKRFSSWPYKERHVKIMHNNDRNSRPCKCPHCEMSFKDNRSLTSHKRTHFGVQPFECGLCAARFTKLCTCKTHQKKIHNVTNGSIIRHDTQNPGNPAVTVSVSNGTIFRAVPTDNGSRNAENDDDEAMEAAETENFSLPVTEMDSKTGTIFPMEESGPEITVPKCEILDFEDEHLEALESDLFDPLADV